MAGGRRRHTIRSYQRRIEGVLSEERKRRVPPPPPISEEHAALRRRIAEVCAEIELDPESRDFRGRPMCTPEGAETALRALELRFEERDLLTRSGVNWHVFQPE
jgi:hypothetical protein